METNSVELTVIILSVIVPITSLAFAASLQAPPGMFKDLNDEILGDAIIINGKQLFIDDYIVAELSDAKRTMHQAVKHPDNPLKWVCT